MLQPLYERNVSDLWWIIAAICITWFIRETSWRGRVGLIDGVYASIVGWWKASEYRVWSIRVRSPHGPGSDCTLWEFSFAWLPNGTPLLNCTCRKASCCAFATTYFELAVHGGHYRVADGNGQQRPVHHSLVDVDAPGQQYVRHQNSVAQAFQHHVVIVFAE